MHGNTTDSPTSKTSPPTHAPSVADDMERARGLLAKDEVSPADRRWLDQAVHRAGGAETPEGGFLWGIVKTIGRKDKERADAFLAASMQRAEAERAEKAQQRVTRWNALSPMLKAAHLLHSRDHDGMTQKLVQLAQLASSDLSGSEPPEEFENPNQNRY
jgi:hypothetical protein